MNIQSILIIIAVLLAVILAIRTYRKSGSSCSCSGGSCDENCSCCNSSCKKDKQ